MYSIPRALAFALLVVVPLASALQVTPGSPCSSVCLDREEGNPIDIDASTTTVSDIVCSDVDFYTSSVGSKYKKCLDCLQNSTKTEGAETDVSWYLYNLRYAVDVCLYSIPNGTESPSSPCSLAQTCGSLSTALTAGILLPNETTYEYCTADNGAFGGEPVASCSQCLQATSDQKYMSNFITALSAGCKQKPVPGTTLSLHGSLFSTTTPLSIIEPPPPNQNQTVAASPNSATTVLTTGAIVGIAVGASLLFLGGIALFFVHWRRQRRFDRADEDPSSRPSKHSGSYSTITSHRSPRPSPYYTSDYKERLPAYEVHDPQDYMNNAEYYDRMDAVRPADGYYAQPASNLSILPAHPAYIPRTLARASRSASPNVDPHISQRAPKPNPTSIQAHSAASVAEPVGIKMSPPAQSSQRRPPPPPIALNLGVGQVFPPPPGEKKALSLVMPSVSNLRGPKRYAPPRIEVQGATPIDGQADMNISLPISLPEERFREGRNRHQVPQQTRSPAESIVEQTIERPLLREYKELPIASGKSALYGM